MKTFIRSTAFAVLLCLPVVGVAEQKTYNHASEYKIAILDENLRVATGSDVTLAKTSTDAKLGPGGQGMHFLHTEAGDFRVEAPINKGRSFLAAMSTGMDNANRPAWAQRQAPTIHNKWFLDNVQPGTKVLFASECAKPNKKHPNESVRCTFWFPDPDSTSHEYQTLGDFTPYLVGDGSNTQKTANTLCGTGKLKPEVEAELCSTTPTTKPSAPGSVAPMPVSAPAAQTHETAVHSVTLDQLGISGDARSAYGVYVASVTPGSPAADANLSSGDIVVSVNGTGVHSPAEAQAALSRSGDIVALTITKPIWPSNHTETKQLRVERASVVIQ